jgi:hypothetical protein
MAGSFIGHNLGYLIFRFGTYLARKRIFILFDQGEVESDFESFVYSIII